MNLMSRFITTKFFLAALLLTALPAVFADTVVRQGAGVSAADIQAAVDAFRADLGANNGVGNSFPGGRREINWDAVPDARSAPNNLPFNFFNSNSPRGAVFSTNGVAVQVSAKLVNPTNTLINFGNLNPAYVGLFKAFSPERLFTAVDSPFTDINFYVPGTATAALSKGFGAVFSDVTLANSTRIQCYDAQGNLIFNQAVPAVPNTNQTFSFLGVSFDTPVIAWVRIISGNVGPNAFALQSGSLDLAVMDDFIYGEPQAADLACQNVCFLSRDFWLLNLRPCGFSKKYVNGDDEEFQRIQFFGSGACRPNGLIHVPGANLENPVSIQDYLNPIRFLLNPNPFGEESLRQQLVAEYIAAQLSLAYLPDQWNIKRRKPLGCYGLDLPQTLTFTTAHLSAFTTLDQLFEITKQELKGEDNPGRQNNYAKLLAIYQKLQASCAQ